MLVGLEALTDMKLVAERKITHSLIFPLILHFFSFSSIFFIFAFFLVACYATLHPALSVRRSVGWSVGRSPFYFFGVFELFEHTAPAQMP